MKAIKKRIQRKYAIPAVDTLVITAKDNTQRLAKAGEDVIITEDDGSQYSMAKGTFDKKYDIIDTETCISKANEIDFVLNTSDNNIVFPASWGEEITAFPGAAIVLENGTFGYAIQEKEFEETYDIVNAKSLNNTCVADVKNTTSDIKIFGDGDLFKLISKASSKSQKWMKSTKAMEIPDVGCVIQVTTENINPDGSKAVAEALTFVPGVRITKLDRYDTLKDIYNIVQI